MKKALWFLSALALTGLVAVACDDGTEPCNGLCEDDEACVRVQNDASHCFDADFISQRSDCLNADGSWVDGWALYLDDDEGLYLCRSNDDDYGDTCTTNDQCPGEQICDPNEHICVDDTTPKYKYVRIDDKSPTCTKDGDGKCSGKGSEDPGADIDAVALIKSGKPAVYAVAWAGYSRADGVSSKGDKKYLAADPEAAVGAPDGVSSYAINNGVGSSDGNCNYFKAGTNNIGHADECEADKDSCDWTYTFVSLGGEGGYLILEMGDTIEEGDKIDVLEVGNCTLQNTASGSHDNAKVEKMVVSVSVSSNVNGDWRQIGEKDTYQKGIASFTVSGGIL